MLKAGRMIDMIKHIDMANYARRAHFDYFRAMAYPYVGVTVDVDVTALKDGCKARGVSFYMAFMHAAALAADSISEFRQRIAGEGIVEYDECPTSHIELLEDGTYCYCTLRHHMPSGEFFAQAASKRAAARACASIEEDGDADSMYFITCLPKLHYSALVQPVGGDSNPRISWGGYRADGAGRLMLPVSVLAHHALIDGSHIAMFYERLDAQVEQLAKELGECRG